MEDSKEIIVNINNLERREAFANELLLLGYSVRYQIIDGEPDQTVRFRPKDHYIVAIK